MKTMDINVIMGMLLVAGLVRPGLAILAFTDPRPLPLGDGDLALQQQSSAVAKLRGGVASAVGAFVGAEADAGMGQDLVLDLAEDTPSSSGPATLEEYCAGTPTEQEKSSKMAVGQKVKANWEGYGTMYPGRITEKHADGTVDILYDDGFTEKGVDAGSVEVVEEEEEKDSDTKKSGGQQARDDPACELQDFLKNVKKEIHVVKHKLGDWMAGERARMAEEDMPEPPVSVTKAPVAVAPPQGIASPAPAAPATEDQTEELEKLKAQLADLDTYIDELEEREAEYDEKLAEKTGADGVPTSAPGVKTVDDLIAEYKAKIAQRQAHIKELLARIKQQQAQLASLGHSQVTLKDIEAALANLEKDVEEGKKKRDELEKAGELDPELRAVIDDIIKAISKLRAKIDNLMALEAKAEEERKLAKQEAKEAEEAARKKARKEGKNEDEAAAEARKAAMKKSRGKERKAELATMEAAADVEKDLKEADKGANKLDTGLHPHGDKWWRYRYEHSHIEAMIMIFISFLMLLWSEFWRKMKKYVYNASLPIGASPKTELEDAFEQAHGTILIQWLHFLADQMLVCVFVFLTIWLIAKTPFVDYLPLIITPTHDMRVPHTGAEYRRLAVDICTIFFFAIAFYFALMFSVAHCIRHTTAELEQLDKSAVSDNLARPRRPSVVETTMAGVSSAAMGSLTGSAASFANIRTHFMNAIQQQIMIRDDPELKEISRLLNDDFNNFPLSQYLKINVRMVGAQLFLFSWTMWLPMIGLFLCLLLLHRFAHMSYIRIMFVASLFVLVMIVTMGYATKSFMLKMEAERADKGNKGDKDKKVEVKKGVHEVWNTEGIFLGVLEFALFFTCYGTARVICQPWMWELHFWPVLFVTLTALLCAVLFVLIVAPAIPNFLCIMSLPPFVDSFNMAVMKQCAIEHTKTQKR